MKPRRIFLLMLVLVVAVASAYSSSFGGKFMLDDYGRIIDNVLIRDFSLLARNISNRALVDLTFAVDYRLGGLNSAYFHFTNLLIHISCSLVLFGLIRALLLASGTSLRKSEWIAFCSALLWGVHPLTTSAVTYICQRYESMMTLLYLMAMLLLAYGIRSAGWKGRLLLVASACSCFLGMFCKQVMITAPFVLLLMDVIFFAEGWREAFRKRWVYYLGLLFCWLTLGYLIYIDLDNHMAMFSAYSARQGRLAYLLNQSIVILHYLRISVWPHPLSIDYAWQPVIMMRLLVIPTLLLAGLGVSTVYGLLKWPRAFFAGACFFIVLSPTSSVIPIPDLAFEQRLYMPLAGLVVSLVLAVSYFVNTRKGQMASVALCALIALSLGIATFRRNLDYHDPESMWRSLVMRVPHNFRAWYFLVDVQLNEGEIVDAEASARQMLARVALAEIDKSGKFNIPSSNPEMYRALGENLLGRALLGQDKREEALAHFSKAVREHPNDRSSRHNRALALLALGYNVEAEKEIDAILLIDSSFREGSMIKVYLLSESGKYREAIGVLERVLVNYPGFVPAKVELAWLLSVSPDSMIRNSDQALLLLERVEEAMGMSGIRISDIKAAAYAEKGDFARAIELQTSALSDAKKRDGNSLQVLQLAERLELYRAGEPFVLRPVSEQ